MHADSSTQQRTLYRQYLKYYIKMVVPYFVEKYLKYYTKMIVTVQTVFEMLNVQFVLLMYLKKTMANNTADCLKKYDFFEPLCTLYSTVL